MSVVRLIPAATDIEEVKKIRKEEAAKATINKNASQKLNSKGCDCKANARCPFTENDIGKMPEGGTTFTMREIMETQACYIPMVKDNYTCHKIHVLAIKGTARESDFMDLLQAEPDSVNCRDSAGNTPLMLACVARDVSITVYEALLERSSKQYVNFENKDGLTALHFAVLNNQPELVEKLIAHGADINAGRVKVGRQHYGLTPLLVTVVCNRTDENRCLDVLLNHGPDITVETVRERFSDTNSLHFHMECDCGGCRLRVPASGSLLKPSKIKTVHWVSKGPAVFLATLHELPTSLSTLLDKYDEAQRHQVMFDMKTSDQSLNLCGVAIRNMRIETLKVLINKESSIVNKTMDTFHMHSRAAPLHLVLMRKRCFEGCFVCAFCRKTLSLKPRDVMEVLDPLLDCTNIDVNTTIANGRKHTPLLMAANKGHDYVIEKLLNRGADPTAVDVNRHTAVDLALKQKPKICLKILKVLFKTGISHEIHGQSFANSLTLRKVSEKKDVDILTLFRKAGALSEPNRLAMYNVVLTTGVEKKDKKKKEQFLKALKTADPFPLQQIVQMYLSAKAIVESPEKRPEAVKEVLRKFISETDTSNQTDDEVKTEDKDMAQKAKAKRKGKKKRKRCHRTSNNVSVAQADDVTKIKESCSSDDKDGQLNHLCTLVQDLLHINLCVVGVEPR